MRSSAARVCFGSSGIDPCPGTKTSASSALTASSTRIHETPSPRHVRKFVVEEHLAHVDDPVLGHEQDAVALRVRGAEVEDLDLLVAKIERHAIAKRDVRQPCALLLV